METYAQRDQSILQEALDYATVARYHADGLADDEQLAHAEEALLDLTRRTS